MSSTGSFPADAVDPDPTSRLPAGRVSSDLRSQEVVSPALVPSRPARHRARHHRSSGTGRRICLMRTTTPRSATWQCDERTLLPGKDSSMWWLGRGPTHHIDGSLLRARTGQRVREQAIGKHCAGRRHRRPVDGPRAQRPAADGGGARGGCRPRGLMTRPVNPPPVSYVLNPYTRLEASPCPGRLRRAALPGRTDAQRRARQVGPNGVWCRSTL
jgi:hypothetical protein